MTASLPEVYHEVCSSPKQTTLFAGDCTQQVNKAHLSHSPNASERLEYVEKANKIFLRWNDTHVLQDLFPIQLCLDFYGFSDFQNQIIS